MHARAFRPAGLPIARARMSLVRTAQSWIRTFPQIFAYILNAHSALACSRASMSWLINPRARTLRARPSVRALTGSRQAESTESSGFRVRSVSGSTRVHPSRACMLGFPGTLHDPNLRIRLSPGSRHAVQTGHAVNSSWSAHALYAPACLTRALRVYACAPFS